MMSYLFNQQFGLVNHLLGISGIDPMEHGLLMERFC